MVANNWVPRRQVERGQCPDSYLLCVAIHRVGSGPAVRVEGSV